MRTTAKRQSLRRAFFAVCTPFAKGNKWTDVNSPDVWDIEQRNTDGSC